MKFLTKFALVGATLAASTGAYADVVAPSGGVGQAVLFVKNELTGAVYARGITLSADQVATQAAIAGDSYTGVGTTPDESLSFSLSAPIAADGNLSTFLGAAGAKSWAVMLADSSGSLALGEKRLITTSAQPQIGTPSNSNINTSTAGFNIFIGSLNAFLPDSGDNSIPTGGLWDETGATANGEQADLWFSAGLGVNNKIALGDSARLYMLTTSGLGTSAAGRQYYLGGLTLSADGTLSSINSVPEVPLPPAIWMLGSALAGFAGLRRRRVDVRVNGVAAA